MIAAMDFPPPDFEFHPILASEIVLITSVDHPLAGRDSVTIEELGAYPFIGYTPAHYVRQVADIVLRLHGTRRDVVVEVDGWGVITNYVAAGIGIAFVPDLCLSEHDRVWKISFEGLIPPRMYGAVTRRERVPSLTASLFVQTMAPDSPQTPEGHEPGR